MNVRYVLLINLLLAAVWPAFQPDPSASDFFVGFVLGFVLLALLHRNYGRRMFAGVAFVLFLIVAIIKSSFQVAGLILSPKLQLDQGIIAIPMAAESPLEIAVLATAITLTPGTLSVDVGRDGSGQQVLYVHNLVIGDPEAMRTEIKESFERRILRVTRDPVEGEESHDIG